MKYTRVKQHGFMIYTSEDGRIVIREGTRRRRTKKVFGRGGRNVTEKIWNVFVDGELVARDLTLLRDAKWIGEAAAAEQTPNPWAGGDGGCLVGKAAEGKRYPCDDDLRETKTGEIVNIKTTAEAHFNLPTRRGTVASLKEIEKFPGVKKGSARQVKAPKSKRKKNPRKRGGKTRAQKMEESSREVLRQIVGGPYSKEEIQAHYNEFLQEAQALARKLGVRLTAADKAHLMKGAEYGQAMELIEVNAWLRERAAKKRKKKTSKRKNPRKATTRAVDVGALVRKALR